MEEIQILARFPDGKKIIFMTITQEFIDDLKSVQGIDPKEELINIMVEEFRACLKGL